MRRLTTPNISGSKRRDKAAQEAIDAAQASQSLDCCEAWGRVHCSASAGG